MSETKEEVFVIDELEVDETGYVDGTAITREFGDGYEVMVGVSSYEYERRGETRMNHVPIVTVIDSNGSIVTEIEAWDDSNPKKAIKNAKGAAESVLKNPCQYIN